MRNLKKASWLAMTIGLFVLISSCSEDKSTEPEVQSANLQTPARGEQPAANVSPGPAEGGPPAGDWEESFKFVRDGIRTEPSRFPLKTADGVRWGRSGNSLEKALLFAQLLQDGGNAVQIAEGELDDAAAAKLLESIFPEGKTFSYNKDVPISAPAKNPSLVSAVKRHFWVQKSDGDNWIDLDPSYPGAEPGRAFASVKNVCGPSDGALKTRVSIVLEYSAADSGELQPVLSWEGKMEEAANQPLSLTVVAKFQKAAEEGEEEEGGGAGVFGALGGQSSRKKKSQAGETVSYSAALTLNGDTLADGQASPGKAGLNSLVLKLKFESLGEVVSESERVLFEKTETEAEAPIFQRHAILIAPNRIPAEVWQGRLQTVSDKNVLADVKSKVEDIKKSLKSNKVDQATLQKSADLEQRVGSELGFLLTMVFASISDDQTEKEEAALSVSTYYQIPRILICSFSGDQETSRAAFDLRQDRIEAVLLPGQALTMKRTFLYGRGVMESILEGKLLERLTGKPALTTAALMQKAAQQKIPIRSYSSLEKENINQIGPPDRVSERLFSALDSGRIVVVPDAGIEWQGQQRWGWWDIDPRTMETIGVMDTGLHQAVLERTILDSKGAVESKMGFVIGAIVGAVDTQWMIAGMVLQYGEINKAALLEAKAYMKEINALMCPGFEKKVGVSAGVTLIDIEDCWQYGIGVSAEAGIEIKQGWCENFAKGFACASTQILNFYLSQFED
jgi:hypothetical protein